MTWRCLFWMRPDECSGDSVASGGVLRVCEHHAKQLSAATSSSRVSADLLAVRALIDIAINKPGDGWRYYAENARALLEVTIEGPTSIYSSNRNLRLKNRELTEDEKQDPEIKEMLAAVHRSLEEQQRGQEFIAKATAASPSSKESHDRLIKEAQDG